MRGLFLFLLLFLLAANSAPQQSAPPQAEQPRPAEKCAIEGQVLKLTGEPLKKALPTLRRAEDRDPGFAATADASGKVIVRSIACK